jgi:uncharacterized protein YcbX
LLATVVLLMASSSGNGQEFSLLEQFMKEPLQFLPLGIALVVMIVVRLLVRRAVQPSQEPSIPQESASSKIVLTQIFIYPIKSCKGIALQKATIGPFGLENDRRWMVYNSETNRFCTQRVLPKMALIAPSFEGNNLCLNFPDMPTMKIPTGKNQRQSPIVSNIGIWKDNVRGVDEGDDIASWISDCLQTPGLRLIRMCDNHDRPIPQEWMHKDIKTSQQLVSYADGFPFLLASEESLQELNSRLPSGVDRLPMTRFRPNLVIKGLDAGFDEDKWAKIKIGNATFRVTKKCTRCKLTTVDPEMGAFAGDEPLRTLKTFRKGLLEGKDEVCFGQNLVHERSGGELQLGQAVQVIS